MIFCEKKMCEIYASKFTIHKIYNINMQEDLVIDIVLIIN